MSRICLLHPEDMRGKVPPDRRSGRTTARILIAIGDALDKPGIWVPLIDNKMEHESIQRACNAQMVADARAIIDRLGLRGYSFRGNGNEAWAIRCDIFVDAP